VDEPLARECRQSERGSDQCKRARESQRAQRERERA